jgi:hypothetical protein
MISALLSLALAAAQPSFDCARARTAVERTICASEMLAALDREEARLYEIALTASPDRRQSLIERQRRFVRDRNECASSYAPLDECIRDAYLGDVADIRRLSGAAAIDQCGLSSGPFHFDCDADYPDVYITLFELIPAQGYASVPEVNEGQPLVAGQGADQLYVGRYATDWIYDPRTSQVRIGARICTRAG